MLKSVVINNLVPEEKREILFTTELSDESETSDFMKLGSSSEINILTERMEKIESVVHKLIEYLAHVSSAKNCI